MNIVKVKSLKDSVNLSLEKIANQIQDEEVFKVALTGGRFGEKFIKALSESSLEMSSWMFFQTDERLLSHEEDVIQRMIENSFSTSIGGEDYNFNFFNPNVVAEESFQCVANALDQKNIKELNLCFLSLGEDGHLAGHFDTSNPFSLDKRFCSTDSAPKLPQNRISFDVKWLSQSQEVLLLAIGKDKQGALERFVDGSGFHSENLAKSNLTVITDLDIY